MRTLQLVGRQKDGVLSLIFRCSWCKRFRCPEDEQKVARGARISHGLCPKCAKEIDAEIDGMGPNAA